MRVLAFTDTHANEEYEKELLRKIGDVEFAICAGDFSNFGRINWDFIEKMDSFGKKIFFVYGTHEDMEDIERIDKDYENWILVHNRIYKHLGFIISGYGNLEFRDWDPNLVKLIKRLKRLEKVIFISHVPPFNTSLDILWNENVGNPLLSEVIYSVKPILYVCGHLHENFYVEERILNTLLINPGPEGTVIEL